MLRVNTLWIGLGANGGGITQFFFTNLVGDAQGCVDATQDFWDALLPGINDGTSFEIEPLVTELNDSTGALVSVVPVTTEGVKAGTASGDQAPTATQGLLRLTTGAVINGRILRGRVFIPAVDEFYTASDGNPSSAYRDLLEAAGQALVDDPTASWAVWHRPNGGSAGDAVPVESVSASTKFAVLRSRRD